MRRSSSQALSSTNLRSCRVSCATVACVCSAAVCHSWWTWRRRRSFVKSDIPGLFQHRVRFPVI